MATVLVTGVRREAGIAAAVGKRLRTDGHAVVTAGWTTYDTEHRVGVDAQTATDIQADLSAAYGPAGLIDQAI
ncbi:MAG: hypothetical protein M0T77_09625 [Actinomycetota bacterium]|nr:hypothetical protein [Actinomycetota bacterium]